MKKNKTDLAKIDALAVEVLSDEELEAVTGGLEADLDASSASCSCCVAGATVITKQLREVTSSEA